MRFTAAILLLGLVPAVSHAKLYKWVDAQGNVHYSDTMPAAAESATRGTSELNQRGMVVKKGESAAEREARLKQEAEDARKEAERQEQARKDKALLQTFTSTKEIDVIRDRNLEQVDAALTTNKARRAAAEKRIITLQALAAKQKAQGHPRRAEETLSDIADVQAEIAAIDLDSAKQMKNRAQIIQKAEADKKRLIELKGQ